MDLYNIVVVDDGSTDGTSESISELYPQVHLLHGDGNLWWTGAVRMGMEFSIQSSADLIVWLNDDCFVELDAINRLVKGCMEHPESLISAKILDPNNGKLAYPGLIIDKVNKKTYLPFIESNRRDKFSYIPVDAINGNLVCIPTKIVKEVGYPDHKNFPHYHGDTEFSYRIKQAGYNLWIDNNALAYCEVHIHEDPDLSFLFTRREAIRSIYLNFFSKKSPSYWRSLLLIRYSLFGSINLISFLFTDILRLLIKFSVIFIFPINLRKLTSRFMVCSLT